MIYVYVIMGMCGSFLLSLALLLFYLRYRKNLLQQQFRIQQTELDYQKKLTQVIITSQEQERKRIGKDLHDDVGNALASLRLYLDKYDYQPGSNEHLTFKASYQQRIGSILEKLRSISHQLSVAEIERFGLREALFMLCEHVEQSGAFAIDINESDCRVPDNLAYDTAVVLYRVFQELLTNTIKHARANQVRMNFKQQPDTGNLHIHYSDNGKGIASEAPMQGLGFKNIESRLQTINGHYTIDRAAQGFHMHIWLPQTRAVTAE